MVEITTQHQVLRDGEPGFRPGDLPPGPTLRYALSLGNHCYVSGWMGRVGWRRFTGPFDWIFSSPAMVRECLEDDFQTFLDRRYLISVPVEERKDPHYELCRHTLYEEKFKIKDVMFNHHDVSSDEGYAALVRGVQRFRRAVRQDGPALLIMARWDHLWDAEAEFQATVDVVERLLPGCALAAFTVMPEKSSGVLPMLHLRTRVGRSQLVQLNPIDRWLATEFTNGLDEVAIGRVLLTYPVKLAKDAPVLPEDIAEHPQQTTGTP